MCSRSVAALTMRSSVVVCACKSDKENPIPLLAGVDALCDHSSLEPLPSITRKRAAPARARTTHAADWLLCTLARALGAAIFRVSPANNEKGANKIKIIMKRAPSRVSRKLDHGSFSDWRVASRL